MTHMLNKLLNLKEKGKYKYAPCLYLVQASQVSKSNFILIEIDIHVSISRTFRILFHWIVTFVSGARLAPSFTRLEH